MAELWDLSDFDDEEEVQPQKVDKNDPKSLRAYARKTARENDELRKQLAELSSTARTKSIADRLVEKKIPAKVAKLIPADVATDKIDEWLDEFKDLWAAPANPAANEADEDVDEETVAERDALSRMSAATGATVPATRPNDLMAQITDPTQTREGLLKLIEAAGGGYGSG